MTDSPDRWHRPPNRHVYLGPTVGAGKTYNYVTNQAVPHDGPYVIIDSKGVRCQRLDALFHELGHEVRGRGKAVSEDPKKPTHRRGPRR